MALSTLSFANWSGLIRRAALLGASLRLGHPATWAQVLGTPVDLRCEYLANPLGLDVTRPRFTVRLHDDWRGAAQKAYQLTVGADSLAVAQGRALT
jgi:alpha-L-rhamnosidase